MRWLPSTRSFQNSQLKSLAPASISPDGSLYPIDSIEASGYWSWELISEALPFDYDPAADLKTVGKN
jgi:hypothetical protein